MHHKPSQALFSLFSRKRAWENNDCVNGLPCHVLEFDMSSNPFKNPMAQIFFFPSLSDENVEVHKNNT